MLRVGWVFVIALDAFGKEHRVASRMLATAARGGNIFYLHMSKDGQLGNL